MRLARLLTPVLLSLALGACGAEGAPPVPFLRAFGGAERLSRDDLAQEMKHGAKLAKVLRAA